MLMREMEGWTGGTSREGIGEIGKRENMKKGHTSVNSLPWPA